MIHPQILTYITGYTHRSLLTLQGTSTDPYWHYSVHPCVLIDVTVYTNYRVPSQVLTNITSTWLVCLLSLIIFKKVGPKFVLRVTTTITNLQCFIKVTNNHDTIYNLYFQKWKLMDLSLPHLPVTTRRLWVVLIITVTMLQNVNVSCVILFMLHALFAFNC